MCLMVDHAVCLHCHIFCKHLHYHASSYVKSTYHCEVAVRRCYHVKVTPAKTCHTCTGAKWQEMWVLSMPARVKSGLLLCKTFHTNLGNFAITTTRCCA